MPYSGGSYIYLRESYGKDKWGRYVAFLFIFQFLFSAPIEVASGFVAISGYLAYITGITYWVYNSLISVGFCALGVLVLYQDLNFVGKLTIALYVGTLMAIAFALIAGFVNFNPEYLKASPEFTSPSPGTMAAFVYSLGTAARYGIYDNAGYYDACNMGGEDHNTLTLSFAGVSNSDCWCDAFSDSYSRNVSQTR
jgi:amino acid transporter